MKNTLETRLGIFVALTAAVAFLIINVVGGLDKFRRGQHVHALFDSVQELKVGDRVKMAGVEIGSVEAIGLTNNKVKVTIKLREQVVKQGVVKTDSKATIKYAGLMGQNFVLVDFGSPTNTHALEPEQYLDTLEQPDLSAILKKLDTAAEGIQKMTAGFAGDEIHNLMGILTDVMTRNKEPLTTTISNLNVVSGQIVAGQGTVGKLIFDDALYVTALTTVSNLQSAGDEIKLTLAEARKVIGDVNAGQGTLGRLVKDETLYNETTASMTNLKEILQKINQGDGTIGKLVNEPEFYKNAKLTLQKVDKATEGLEDQGPLSVIGIIANGLF